MIQLTSDAVKVAVCCLFTCEFVPSNGYREVDENTVLIPISKLFPLCQILV